jgi:hypothetical protein
MRLDALLSRLQARKGMDGWMTGDYTDREFPICRKSRTMKKFGSILVLLGLLAFQSATAQESLPPIPIGGGSTSVTQANGQTLQITASGISATVYVETITASRIAGHVIRTSSGTTEGDVTILWLERNRSVRVHLSSTNPQGTFTMEGGEGDKKSGSNPLITPQ